MLLGMLAFQPQRAVMLGHAPPPTPRGAGAAGRGGGEAVPAGLRAVGEGAAGRLRLPSPLLATSIRGTISQNEEMPDAPVLPPLHSRRLWRHPAWRCRDGAGLSLPSGQDRGAVSGRRLQRHHRAHRGAEALRAQRPEFPGGEPRRRRRQCRGRGGGGQRAGRLHAAADRAAAADDQCGAVQEACRSIRRPHSRRWR